MVNHRLNELKYNTKINKQTQIHVPEIKSEIRTQNTNFFQFKERKKEI